jgi:hypothetical protein
MAELFYVPFAQLIAYGCGAAAFALFVFSFAAWAAGRWFD